MRSGTVADVIEKNVNAVAEQMGIQVRSAWRYFDAAGLAETIAQQHRDFKSGSAAHGVGQAPMPPIDNPELALILGSVPDALAETGGDLYAVVLNAIVNAWLAGHIHGEDGCPGCDGSRGSAGHDWDARMKGITAQVPDIMKWFDRDKWTAALHDSGFNVTRR
ncbi:hypothetical protein STBA_39090 [Streptomyces sp. MP131-18]|nr:hypothetical protein STBA_39090 [Streptomyces sp. MP131-18]